MEPLTNRIARISMILGAEPFSDIEDMVSEIEVNHDIEYGLPLSTVLYSLFEYKKNKELGSFFFENVEKEGVILYETDKFS